MSAPKAIPVFSEEFPPDYPFELWKKVGYTRMARIDGPFIVKTQSGVVECEDGWVAVDKQGYLYPITSEEHRLSYVPVDDE